MLRAVCSGILENVPCTRTAAVAQLEEHMICNLEVSGSSPLGGFSPPSRVLPLPAMTGRLRRFRASTQVAKGGRL